MQKITYRYIVGQIRIRYLIGRIRIRYLLGRSRILHVLGRIRIRYLLGWIRIRHLLGRIRIRYLLGQIRIRYRYLVGQIRTRYLVCQIRSGENKCPCGSWYKTLVYGTYLGANLWLTDNSGLTALDHAVLDRPPHVEYSRLAPLEASIFFEKYCKILLAFPMRCPTLLFGHKYFRYDFFGPIWSIPLCRRTLVTIPDLFSFYWSSTWKKHSKESNAFLLSFENWLNLKSPFIWPPPFPLTYR